MLGAVEEFIHTPALEKEELFNRDFGRIGRCNFSTVQLVLYQQGRVDNYSMELMLAVMSRMVFFRVSLPFFRSVSTLRMA